MREQNYIDVDDVSDAIVKVIDEPKFDVFNIAHHDPVTMHDLANKIVGIIGLGKIQYVDKPDPRDNERSRYSIQKISNAYGWQPKYTIEQTIAKILRNIN
jgi:nucleoside-diphosphate-sugar epimerase